MKEGIVTRVEGQDDSGKAVAAYLTCLRYDVTPGQDTWNWTAVIAVQGDLPTEPGRWDEETIMHALEALKAPVQSVGESGPGRAFAQEPWVQFLGVPVRTLIISQCGGRDV